MLRAQLFLTPALAAVYFVPTGPAATSTTPMLRGAPMLAPAPVEILQQAPPQGARGVSAAAAFAFVAGAAATFTAVRSAGPRMDEAASEAVEAAEEARSAGVRMQEAAVDAPQPLILNGKELVGASDEIFNQVWDPLNLGSTGSDQTLAWFRHAELKHCRAAMLASVGYVVQVNHAHFPGMLSVSKNISFAQLAQLKPYEAWEATPVEGKLQIALLALIIELRSEAQSPEGHYMRGGTPGDIQHVGRIFPGGGFPKIDALKRGEEEYIRREKAELKHGRAAMLFLASLIAANNIEGSVPALTNAAAWLG